jgi:hypothetical protein
MDRFNVNHGQSPRGILGHFRQPLRQGDSKQASATMCAMFAARPFPLNTATSLVGVAVRATITKTTTIKG